MLGATGELAVANTVRNPRRVAATATALVIGIGLVSAFMVGARSTKDGIERSVDAQIGTDFVVSGIGQDLPAALAGELAARPELGVVHEQRSTVVADVEIRAAHPALVGRTLSGVLAGDADRVGPGQVLVHRELAQARGWQVGSAGDRRGQAVPGGRRGHRRHPRRRARPPVTSSTWPTRTSPRSSPPSGATWPRSTPPPG